MLAKEKVVELAKTLKLLILDVDGVLTDGKLYFDNDGNEYKSFHARDGHGIKLLQQTGVSVAVISGRRSNSVALRMRSLGVELVYQGHENKISAFYEILEKMTIEPEKAAYIGDDLLDLPLIKRVGLGIAVQDANFMVKQHAQWCTELAGGCGAVREVCDLIMQAQGTFDDIVRNYLK
jgi:3-deoxy-D-manno-octulosonate 8-phosphate phosphatase (KDO 8-P phosphatase)